MTVSIGFDLSFPKNVPPVDLLRELLQAGFNNFLRPKMGRIATYGDALEFGQFSFPYEQIYESTVLIEGEQMVAPGITTLLQHPDLTKEIVGSLPRFSMVARSHTELIGDFRMNYVENADVKEGWLFRFGDDVFRFPIVCFSARDYGPPSWVHRGSGISLGVDCPWFFLKDWRLEGAPAYSTPEVAEYNWNRLLDFVHLFIDVGGEEKLKEIYLDFDGWGPKLESEWLIEHAQRLPKLKVHFS